MCTCSIPATKYTCCMKFKRPSPGPAHRLTCLQIKHPQTSTVHLFPPSQSSLPCMNQHSNYNVVGPTAQDDPQATHTIYTSLQDSSLDLLQQPNFLPSSASWEVSSLLLPPACIISRWSLKSPVCSCFMVLGID